MESTKVISDKSQLKSLTKLGIEHYIKNYDEYLESFKDKEFVMLEIGIAQGDSLLY